MLDLSLAQYTNVTGPGFAANLVKEVRKQPGILAALAADLPLDGGRTGFGQIRTPGMPFVWELARRCGMGEQSMRSVVCGYDVRAHRTRDEALAGITHALEPQPTGAPHETPIRSVCGSGPLGR
jgi:hypothetical protein